MNVTVRAMPGVRAGAIRAVIPALQRLGDDITNAMLVHEYVNRTGNLEISTQEPEVDRETGTLTITNTAHRVSTHGEVYYGVYVERGTRHMRPRPFLLPALVSQYGRRT